jgi:hypothetical protein
LTYRFLRAKEREGTMERQIERAERLLAHMDLEHKRRAMRREFIPQSPEE